MNTNTKRNEIFYIVTLILTIITMIVGITFTFYNLIAKEKDDSTKIKVGTMSIDYIEGKTFNAYDLLPIKEPKLTDVLSVYKKEFIVKSSGNLEQSFNIFLKVKENKFDNYALHYSLYDTNKNKIAIGKIPNGQGSRILIKQNLTIKDNEKKDFTLLIWLQDNNEKQDYEEGNTFVGSIEIDSIQKRN